MYYNSFKMINTLDSLLHCNSVKCISINRDTAEDRINYGKSYTLITGDTLFTDKELNILHSPIFVLVEASDYRINDILFILGPEQTKKQEAFMKKILYKDSLLQNKQKLKGN